MKEPLYEHDDAIWMVLVSLCVLAVGGTFFYVLVLVARWFIEHWFVGGELVALMIILVLATFYVSISRDRKSRLSPERHRKNV